MYMCMYSAVVKALSFIHTQRRRFYLLSLSTSVRRGFLGRASVPSVAVLHPPSAGPDDPITLPLRPLNWQEPRDTDSSSTMDNNDNSRGGDGFAHVGDGDDDDDDDDGAKKDVPAAAANSPTTIVPDKRTARADQRDPSGGGRAAGRFANRMIGNVQKHLTKNTTITGTLTLSLETFADEDDEQEGTRAKKRKVRGLIPEKSTVLQEESQAYAVAKFKVAEDASAARMRREKEGIEVPRMLSRVQALHDRLEGDT